MIREEESIRIPLRLLGGKLCAAVELSPNMNEQAWQQMMDMLQALKPGYVAEECSAMSVTDAIGKTAVFVGPTPWLTTGASTSPSQTIS